MKKIFSAIKLKNILAFILCFMLCFSSIFLTSGCIMGDPGTIDDGSGNSGSGSGSGTGGGSGTGSGSSDSGSGQGVDVDPTVQPDNKVTLTIDANGGSYDGYSTYVISRESGTEIQLKTPTYSSTEYLYTFTGWIKIEGNGTLDGNNFTFGSQNTTIKATWQGGALEEELEVGDYIKGATFIYKPLPESNKNNIDAIKNVYLNKIEELLANINSYIDGTFEVEIKDENKKEIKESIKKEILLNYLIEVYGDKMISSEATEIDDKLADILPYVDHLGLFEDETQKLNNVVLDYIAKLNTHTVEDKELNEIEYDETLYLNNDGVKGFGSEVFLKTQTLEENKTTITYNEIKDDKDLGNNGIDLWTKDTFIQYYKLQNIDIAYNEDNFYYRLIEDEGGKLKLETKGLHQEYKVKDYSISLSDGFETHTYIIYAFADDNGYIIEDGKKTKKKIAGYANNSYIDENNNPITPIVIGRISDLKYYPSQNYRFDIAVDGFKNYKNVVKLCVEELANSWNKTPLVYVQQLNLDEMTVDFGDLDADFYDNKIITNTSNSGLTMQGMLLDVKQKVKIESLEVYFEFLNEQNLNTDKIKINVGALYYNKEKDELKQLKLGSAIIKQGETEPISDNFDFGSGGSDSIDINFGSNGITLNTFETKYNNGEYISVDTNGYHHTKFIDAETDKDCFEATTSDNGEMIINYIDKSSDYLLLTFEAEKVDGITPTFKVCFFSFQLATAD